MNGEPQVAIYCRLSKEDGDDVESNSIRTQRLIIENYCKRQGWNVFDTYIDDGFSGTNFERPGFQKMYQDIVDAQVNVVITKDLSRLGRNYIFTGYYYQVFFPQAGVRYIAINDHIDTAQENSDMTMAVFKNIMNDLYSKNLSKSVRAAKKARVEEKINCNGRAPYGYNFNREHKLTPDPTYAPIIRYIFEEYVKNPNFKHISRQLNERNIPTPCSRLLHLACFQNGTTPTKWHSDTLYSILDNPEYMGALTSGRTRRVSPYSNKRVKIPLAEQTFIYDCHEPIVSRELWEDANRIYLKHKHFHHSRVRKTIYQGLLYCAHCGKALHVNSGKLTSCYCDCWPITAKPSSRGLDVDAISRRIVSDIHGLANACEVDENSAFNLIASYLAIVNSTETADTSVELYKIQSHIDTLNDKISNFDKYSQQLAFSSGTSDTILTALEASLNAETAKFEHLKTGHHAPVSEEDIWNFIKATRRFGYLQKIDQEVMNELVDKIFVSKPGASSWFQRGRITIKFKHVGILSTCELTHKGILLSLEALKAAAANLDNTNH